MLSGNRLKGAIYILASTLVYAFQSVIARKVLISGISPIVLTGIKLVSGLAALGLMIILLKKKISFHKKDWKKWLIFGLFGGTFFAFFLSASYSMNGASQGVILLYTAPAFTILLARFYLKEKITPLKLGALALVIVGTILVSLGSLSGELKFTGLGLFFGLASGFSYGVFNVLGKKLSNDYNSWSINFFMVLIAVISILLVLPFFDWGYLLGEKLNFTLMICVYGFLIYGVGNFLFMKGMEHLEAGTVSVLANTEPLLAVLLAALILQERLMPLQIGGFIFIIIGIFMISISKTGYQELSG
ncbi:MAG: DMT family transporter [Fusobacteria bacterium]|nr:DMT family transporter [Fusobacteriota bacterium]